MAETTNKTNTKNKTPSAKKNTTTLKEDVVVKKAESTKKKITPIELSDMVVCRSQRTKMSYVNRKTGDRYVWEGLGSEESMTFETLLDIQRNDRGYLTNLWIKVEDERAVEKLGLAKTYSKYESILNDTWEEDIDTIEKVMKKADKKIRESFRTKAIGLVTAGKIADVKVIRRLEDILSTSLERANLIELI